MKKLIWLAIFLIAIGGVNAATTVDVTWGGFGNIDTTFNSGDDAVAQMWANGNTAGNFQATDSDNNPYNYGVDNTDAWIRGDITNGGGDLKFNYLRTDRQGSAAAGEFSNSFVGSSGTGSMDFRTRSNYHDLVSSNYGFQSSGQFQAVGDFKITHTLQSANVNNWGTVGVIGSGSAVVDYMTDGYTAGNGFRFGSGDGCYTNADILTTGNGAAQVYGQADNYLAAYDGSWTMPVGGSHTESWTYSDGLSVTNFAFQGN